MRPNSTRSMGALHPVLFFMLVYGLSLFMAIFVCRTVYYSMNSDMASHSKAMKAYPASMDVAALK